MGTEPSVVEWPCLEEPPEQLEEDVIDWGNYGVEAVSNTGISAEASGINWGISLESDSKDPRVEGIDQGDDAAALQISQCLKQEPRLQKLLLEAQML